MRACVVGHVEWIEFARVERVPSAGEIVHASETFEHAAGGGAVAAVQLAKLAGEATLFTALGDDELGHRAREELERLGVRVRASFRELPQRRGFTFLDRGGERTITVIGERMVPDGVDPLPWEELASADAVYFTGGDGAALAAARAARCLVATPRAEPALAEKAVELDALVGSGRDQKEVQAARSLEQVPHLAVSTAGAEGGSYRTREGGTGSWSAAPLPGPVADAYGCGDSFAAGLTYGLGAGYDVDDALALAAQCGAACLTGAGPYEGQLTRASP